MTEKFNVDKKEKVRGLLVRTLADCDKWIISPGFRLDAVMEACDRLKSAGMESNLSSYLRGDIPYHETGNRVAFKIGEVISEYNGIDRRSRTAFLKELADVIFENIEGDSSRDTRLRKQIDHYRTHYSFQI